MLENQQDTGREETRKKMIVGKDSGSVQLGPVGLSRDYISKVARTHPEAGQVRQEGRREEAVFPGSEKRPHGNGWGVSKPSFLLCFLSDQE